MREDVKLVTVDQGRVRLVRESAATAVLVLALEQEPSPQARVGRSSRTKRHTRPTLQEAVRVRSTAQIAGHPMLVPISIACFIGGIAAHP
jgi:hypothetical protein